MLLLFLFFLSVPATIAQNSGDEKACSDAQFYMSLTKLEQVFNEMCGTNVPTPSPTLSSPPEPVVEWESIALTQIGTINMGSTSTQSFLLPNSVPDTAKEVLVYVYAYMGFSSNRFSTMKVFTEANATRKFIKYLAIRTYHQEAYSTVSENMWFPMPSNRHVYVMLSQALTGNVHGFVNVIGYH